MRSVQLPKRLWLKSDALAAGLIFTITFLIFWASPFNQIADSRYSMVFSQSLLEHRSFTLDGYAIPRLKPVLHGGVTYLNGNMYQLQIVGEHLYYYFPPGTSVLSAPFVAVMNFFGVSAVNADGTYNSQGEERIQAALAAFLMALLAVVFFYMSRLLLPPIWSVVVALGGALGTQVWSTASRGMWTHTWGILLLGLMILIVLAQETGKRKLNGAVLASLLAWMYFVRPTNSIFIVALSVYIFVYHRRAFIAYAATGAAWFAGFVSYSWYHYGQLLPDYYQANRLDFGSFWIAFAGNLVSPSRGLLVYVPVLLFVVYLLVQYRRQLLFPHLTLLALAAVLCHLVTIAGFSPWNGGGCYGARYSTELVPWFVLLGILGVKAMLTWRDEHATRINAPAWNATLVLGALLLLLSVFMNGRGATSSDTAKWNELPVNVDRWPNKVWDWTYPQFLAGLVRPPLPDDFPMIEDRINFGRRMSDRYLYYGWSGNENEFRWTDANEAAIIFGLDEIAAADLQMKLSPFLAPGRVDEQRVTISLNGNWIETLVLRETGAREHSLALPQEMLRHENILTFELPDAASPMSFGVGDDPRRLGIAMHWLEIRPRSATVALADRRSRTRAEMPLPDSALRAEISVIDPPTVFSAGTDVTLRVKVKNLSGATWPSLRQNDDERYWIRLGNHWLDTNSNMIMNDDGRAALPFDLEPDEEVELLLTITVPQTAGEYVLEIDMVQEFVSWFKDYESNTAQLRVTVR